MHWKLQPLAQHRFKNDPPQLVRNSQKCVGDVRCGGLSEKKKEYKSLLVTLLSWHTHYVWTKLAQLTFWLTILSLNLYFKYMFLNMFLFLFRNSSQPHLKKTIQWLKDSSCSSDISQTNLLTIGIPEKTENKVYSISDKNTRKDWEYK